MGGKLLFFDYDGTLSEGGRVTKRVISALKSAQSAGNKIVLCTGRAYGNMLPVIFDIGFDGMCAGLGSHVEYGGKLIMLETIARKDVKAAVELLLEHNYGGVAGGSKDRYFFGPVGQIAYRDEWGCKEDQKFYTSVDEVLELYDNDPFEKISVLNVIEDELHEKIVSLDIFGVKQSWYSEYAKIGCSKAKGVEAIIKHTGIKFEDTIAFGDSSNDLEMFGAAYKKIAMGNATDELKAAADEVIGSVFDDGVAVWIENNLL